MKRDKLVRTMEKYSLGLSKRIRNCRASEVEKIRQLQAERKQVEFLKYLVSIHSETRINIYYERHLLNEQLIQQKEAVQEKLF